MADANRETLAYATDAHLDAAQWKSQPRFPRVPAIVIAVGGLFCLHMMFYLGLNDWWLHQFIGNSVEPYTIAAAFLPVLIQKRDRWSLILGAAAIIGLCVLFEKMPHLPIDWHIQAGVCLGLVVFLVAYLWNGPFSIRQAALFRACFLAAFIGLIMQGIEDPVYAMYAYSKRYFETWKHGIDVPWTEMIFPYLFILFVWLGMPWVGWQRVSERRLRHWIVYLLPAIAVAAVIAYFAFVQVWLADRSLRDGYPFDRLASVAIMERHGVSNARFWKALEDADWRPSAAPEMGDWRDWVIQYLNDHDPSAAARFAAMLVAHPSKSLADLVAEILVKHNRFEAIPLLLRYSLASYDGKCTKALASMGVRQAAWPIVFNSLQDAGMGDEAEPRLTASERAQLVAFLGSDAGDDPFAWFDLLNAKAKGPRAGIPAAITEEADEVLQIFGLYWNARSDLRDRQHRRAGELAAAEHLSGEYDRYLALHKKYPQLPIDDLVDSRERLFQLIVRARDETQVAEPDWDAIGTPSLRREIADYQDRVNRLPASSAATAP